MVTMMRTRRNSGFSLIEMAIVISITGLLLAAFLQFYSIQVEASRLETTRKRLDDLRSALTMYVAAHDRLPCPESPVYMASGKQKSDAPADACAANAEAGEGIVTSGDEGGANEVWAGVIPVRDLRLSDEQATDGWGNRFTYAVTRKLTLPDGMKGNPAPPGILNVVDAEGNNVLDAPNTGRYVIVSHGRSGKGAWTQGGGRRPCDREEKDGENCNSDGTFVISSYAPKAGENFYDDIAIHDDADVRGTLLDRIIVCNTKKAFYDPAAVNADQDGCVRQEGVWEGACLRSFTIDPKGGEVTVEAHAVLKPAIATGECSCDKGYKSIRIGAWDDGMISVPTASNPPTQKLMPKRTALYTCVN
ncbi:MAG: type II secretion system protein [Alphaproteobacteria bacterium]|nr:MAG: type II secretion system protein [Alphaproteobacteria bacterium]